MAASVIRNAFPHTFTLITRGCAAGSPAGVTQTRRETTSGHDTRFEELSQKHYWKYKYGGSTELFDWFLQEEAVSSLVCHALLHVGSKKNFSETAHSIHTRVHPVNILDLGCGHSVLPLCCYEWRPFPVAVHCLDFVQEAVDFQLKTLRSSPPGHQGSSVSGVCASVCSLPYRSNLFHLVMDKGTMDSLMKDPTHGSQQAKLMLHEVDKVLCQGGTFMQITDEDPDSRMFFLETHSRPGCCWRFSILTNSEADREYFVYSYSK